MAASSIDQAAALIRDQIKTLDQERRNLERALSALTGSNGRTATTRRRRSGNRTQRGQRQAQLLKYLRANPEARPRDIANGLGISANHVQALLRKGRADKMVKKQRGGGYALTAVAKTAVGGS
jgi:DNA-binding CsgD family transcriptional regulator